MWFGTAKIPPSHWVEAIQSHHWLMSTRRLKCPLVVGQGFKPRSSNRELDPLTNRSNLIT